MNDLENTTVLVTGAAGYIGLAVVKYLLREPGIKNLICLVRDGSIHNKRLTDLKDSRIIIVEVNIFQYKNIVRLINKSCSRITGIDIAFHLSWYGERDNINEQMSNIMATIDLLDVLSVFGCKRLVVAGSQAEYGIVDRKKIMTEDILTKPFSVYGAAKISLCHLSRAKCNQLGIEWIWARVFSVIGKYEPQGRMLIDLFWTLKYGKIFFMSSGTQNWDYLDVHDAAEAFIELAKKGRDGEIYNVANGYYRSLREYTEELQDFLGLKDKIIYGDDAIPYVSLQPSVEKIKKDTGWRAKRRFIESVTDYYIDK